MKKSTEERVIYVNKDLLFEIRWRKALIKKLVPFTEKFSKRAESMKAKEIAKQSNLRSLYPSEEEAHEAFGYGEITEDEYRQIAENLAVPDAPTIDSAARDEMKEFISRLKREVKDFEWEMLPEEKRDAIRNANDKYRNSILANNENT